MAFLAKPMRASIHRLPGRSREAEDWEYPTSRSAAAGPSHHLLIAIIPDGTRYDQDFSSLAARSPVSQGKYRGNLECAASKQQ
ncbi:hypothetical protein ACDY96_13975 [Rhizobium mongolense]|uniref:hypothetical protein n=1 Tax=Rhizobium TaxID=379 RepID=UPI0024B0B5D7|nr:hypothetical protein [Rhizobium sp. CC1099]WFU90380.1 hypothetical protein QA644_30830 [Rhizobium sp. CC1099]